MQPSFWKKAAIAVFVLIVVALACFLFFASRKHVEVPPVKTTALPLPIYKEIGKSVQDRIIGSYTYGTGAKKIVFVGGIHGGYEWNAVALAYRFMDYLAANPDKVPADETVIVIPDLNPDAVYKVTGKEGRFSLSDVSTDAKLLASARFNADGVDLNRNFDCKWQPKSTWQNKIVSAGTSVFSEPEAQAFRDFIAAEKPDAVVFWHSQANAVYASQCGKGILPGTLDIMNTYAKAADYPAVKEFTAYATTGAAEDWLASQDVPAITVELSSHQSIDWEKNLAGIQALLKYFSK